MGKTIKHSKFDWRKDLEGLKHNDLPWYFNPSAHKIIKKTKEADMAKNEVVETPNELKREALLGANKEEASLYAEILQAPPTKRKLSSAETTLKIALDILNKRGAEYDQPNGERSMEKAVKMFNALTGHSLTVKQGWKFMCCLKLVRSEYSPQKQDNYIDGAAYFALASEE